MAKINQEIQDEGAGNKMYGVMPAIVDLCVAEDKVTKASGKKYAQLTVDLSLDNGTENGLKKKMFFRLPYDSWAAKPGEKESLFNQFRKQTGMTKEELSETNSYKGKGFNVLVGPERKFSGEWNTFEGREGNTMLSFNITDILTNDCDKEALEAELAKTIKSARAEVEGGAAAAPKASNSGGVDFF